MKKINILTVLAYIAIVVTVIGGTASTVPYRMPSGVFCDVNNDGNVDGSDINDIINIILGKSMGQPSQAESLVFTVNGVSFTMIKVDNGTFIMGNDSDTNSSPAHQVTLSSYYIAQTEVTRELWQTVMGEPVTGNPRRPISEISWYDCQGFISKLNQLTGKSFRMPTEAEWEFAARGGNKSKGYKYSGSNNIDEVAWNFGNQPYGAYGTHSVATKKANELGLYDMSGNVYEYVWDNYNSYSSSPQVNPITQPQNAGILRGGGCDSADPERYTVWSRMICFLDDNHSLYGFRLAL